MSGSINQLFSLAPWQSAAAQPNALNYAGGDMGLTDISQWLPYQTYAQFLPQQTQQAMQPQPQDQSQQPQASGQPQQLTPDQQAQQMAMLMQIAGVGRPNYGGAGPGGDQGAAGQGY